MRTTTRLLALALALLGCRGQLRSEPAAPAPDGGASPPDSGVVMLLDGGPPPDAGALPAPPPPVDAGPAPTDAAGPAPEPMGALRCEPEGDSATLRDADGRDVARYADAAECAQAVAAAGARVVCVYFTEDMPVGPGGWSERGWRAMNVDTGIGLGRVPHESFGACLDATRSAPADVVCTNTGVGFKGTHVETNTWCGSSSALAPCLVASAAARDGHVCSFPSDGDGTNPGWVLTRIGATCDYLGGPMSLEACNAMLP